MTLIDDPDILKHSVTRDDPDVLNPGGRPQVLWLTFPNAAYMSAPTGVLPIDIPLPWSRARDRLLITTVLHETMWGAAIAKAIAKMITLGFTVEDRAKSERRTSMAQNRLLMANNGKGWTSFLWQHLSDYLLTDNGSFVELVYKSSNARSQFLGFMHLDSIRCLGRDTRIMMGDGSVKRIVDIVRNRDPGPVMAMDNAGQLVPKAITNWYESRLADRSWMRLVLSHAPCTYGRRQGIWLTNDHQVSTLRGWIRADELQPDDRVITPYPDLTAQQSSILVGSLLGDASITKGASERQFVGISFTQGHKQREWLDLKMSAFNNFRWSPIRGSTTLQASSQTTPALHDWRTDWYPNGKKIIPRGLIEDYYSDQMLATWYMDDGDLHSGGMANRRPAARIATHCFSKEDVEWLASFLTSKGYDTRIHNVGKDQYGLYITADSSKTFFEAIAPFVPPTMRYKLPPNMPPYNPAAWDIYETARYADTIAHLAYGDNAEQTATYCIDVEGEHNFIAADMLVHNCTRTGDPEIPVIYEDLRGRMHELRTHQVLTFVDMESGRAEARGTGLCAASRAYPTIHKIAGLERYVDEKVTGTNQKEIHIVNGISGRQLEQGLRSADEDVQNKGLVMYKGVAVIAATKMDATLSGYKIPIAEVPDGFSAKEERDNTYLKYANCIGLPLTDIQPLSGQGLGTGKQSEIIDDAGSEFGLAAWGKAWEHASNEGIMPTTTTFSWADKSDARKQAASADVSLKRATTRAAQVASGEITPQQALQLAADAGDVPDSFLQSDETPDDVLTDTEKPVTDEQRDAMDTNQPELDQVPVEAPQKPVQKPQVKPATVSATKTRKLTIADLDDEQALKEAEKLYEEVRG